MWPRLSSNYLVSAIFLNPVILLHSLNSILQLILPNQSYTTALRPSFEWSLGPSAEFPFFDVHSSNELCWGYTLVMVFAQLFVYSKVHRGRKARKERSKNERARQTALLKPGSVCMGMENIVAGKDEVFDSRYLAQTIWKEGEDDDDTDDNWSDPIS